MAVPVDEQETTLQYSRNDKTVRVWTSDTTVMTKLDKLCDSAPGYYRLTEVGRSEGEMVFKTYEITNKRMLSFRSGSKSRTMTEEQKRRAVSNLKRAGK